MNVDKKWPMVGLLMAGGLLAGAGLAIAAAYPSTPSIAKHANAGAAAEQSGIILVKEPGEARSSNRPSSATRSSKRAPSGIKSFKSTPKGVYKGKPKSYQSKKSAPSLKKYRGRRWHDGVRWYYWAPWVGAYLYYNSYDACYSSCRNHGYSVNYCTDLCLEY